MTIKHKILVTALLLSFLVLGIVQTTHAYLFYIDQFSVTKNGSTIFNDTFSDGNPPRSAPDLEGGRGPVSYFVNGAMGPESGGKLTFNGSGAVLLPDPSGNLYALQSAILNTYVGPDITLGLRSDDTFSVTGVFDLIPPSVPGESYGVVLNDGTNTNDNDDVVYLMVRRSPLNNLVIGLSHADYVAHTLAVIDYIALEQNHDQIALTLTKADMGSDVITGSFAYIDGGTMGPTHTFGNTTTIFGDENFTRAEFEVSTPVPEPNSMLLLCFGVIGALGLRRKLKK